MQQRVLVAELGRPHGVRGLLRVRDFSVAGLAAFPVVWDAAGRAFRVAMRGADLVAVEGVADRDAAARLTGTKLYVERASLPPAEEDEFYLADLVGLRAEDAGGAPYGVVRAVEDHGGGAYLILSGPPERLVPFTRVAVPVVDVAGGRVVVELPAEVDGEVPG